MTTDTTPETFDFADWFADANLPESSADIYLNAAVLSDLADIQRRMDVETRVEEAEAGEKELGSKAKKTPLQVLEDEYVALAKKFEDSKITVYVRALTSVERKEIRAAHDLAQKNDGEENQGFTFRCLAASIVGLRKATGERKPATLTQAEVEDLYKKIGDAQIGRINDAYLTATNAIPAVDADFLRKLSGPAAGPES
ncbi:hypothetical protein PTW37_06495 [Arthrobacter agilis]|uniref:hypothetical protein n=1 Tax=Arthrobacter agilis TaxID=37921 RepID=UPI002365A94B|nr:hypothetical protein [Arthrobacter agilis]WDF34543.1 hypothetical protein PTW37_06495 [Arthrobacter agilis]